jgi:DNA-binding response OmpR family regulator
MKIVLVEDDKFFHNFYAAKLKEKGFDVDVASDGEEGLALIKKTKPNIILLDLIMPKKDGFEVLEALSKDPELNKIPVLVFSTLGQEKDIERAKKLGATDYTNKSFFDFDKLLAKIHSLGPK